MIELGPCEITAVFGPMCSGKTFLINSWLRAGQNRYVRFDATGETTEDAGVEHIWANPKELAMRLLKNPYYYRIAYHPASDLQREFEDVLSAVWRLDPYKTLVMDEFHEVAPVNDTPEFVRTMMRYARHAHLAVIGASQRLADVHKLFTGGARQVILFRNDDARDKEAVRQRWGVECEYAFSNLRPLIHNDATGATTQLPQCIVIPRGGKPRIYDFKTESYVAMGTRSESDSAEEDFQGESGDGSTEEQSGEGNRGGELEPPDVTANEGQ